MKTPRLPQGGRPRCAALPAVLLGLVGTSAALVPCSAADSKKPEDHVLFVGTNLALKEDGKFYHIVGANKDSLTIQKDLGTAEVHKPNGADVRVDKGVKLSNVSATISDVKTESVDRASAQVQLQALKGYMYLIEEASMAEDRLHGDLIRAQYFGDRTVDSFHGDTGDHGSVVDVAMRKYVQALPGLESLMAEASSTMVQNITRPQISSPEVELTFNVSSPVRLLHPYVIVVASYAADNQPNVVEREVTAQAFDHIDGKGQRVRMSHAASKDGLPFKKFDLALFSNGQEVATNLSEKRTSLTDDQAYQFFLLDYLGSHKHATVPPAPMLMIPREEFRVAIADHDAGQDFYVSVDKTGKVLSLTSDQAGTRPVPAPLEAALHNVRFLPALADGKPVDGRARFTLAELAR
ncbi:MAG TPA: hypothetical protein VHE13_04045 [Opitutus sp.]|nr:hypothetical protein [Opitutus sp.]